MNPVADLTGSSSFEPGQWVIYRKSKRGSSPGPRATSVKANAKGETYSYTVDKFWVVDDVLPSGEVQVRTPGGKTHRISTDDPNLRRAGLIARMLWRHRFERAASIDDPAGRYIGESPRSQDSEPESSNSGDRAVGERAIGDRAIGERN